MSKNIIHSMLWTTGMLVFILILLSLTPGCTSTGKSALLPWNWDISGAKHKEKDTKPDFDNDSQKVLGVKLTYEALQRMSFIVPVALAAIVLGSIVMFSGHSVGTKILGAGFVALTVYFGIVQYTQWISLIGFLGILSIMGYVLFIKTKGWNQTVMSVDALLQHFPEQKENMIEILEKNQPSKMVRKLIKKIKASAKYEPVVWVEPGGPGKTSSTVPQTKSGFAIMDDETDQKGRPLKENS